MQITQKNFYKKFLGRAGEVKAAGFLKDKGYKILEKNYKTHILLSVELQKKEVHTEKINIKLLIGKF